MQENLSSGVCKQHRCRPACAYVQVDQRLYLLIGKYHLVSVAEQDGLGITCAVAQAGQRLCYLLIGKYHI